MKTNDPFIASAFTFDFCSNDFKMRSSGDTKIVVPTNEE
eukprot:CAMPEP_0203681836 /NCGR_PEP_ID=MMETSP0090-20130426/43870_1 /ASSEMBLY_ACC=CAM_ASM_001088 /TAXON_ID=426623 /ORGANISM="Chaetoceros affinis, Strain CCMP159" /LENGTH=38 /DNA_ID= /DNA_START= /DNA_END= /DNA_ORIENTATION=